MASGSTLAATEVHFSMLTRRGHLICLSSEVEQYHLKLIESEIPGGMDDPRGEHGWPKCRKADFWPHGNIALMTLRG